MRETKRVLILTDEEIDRLIAWYEDSSSTGCLDLDESDEEIAEKLRAARLKGG